MKTSLGFSLGLALIAISLPAYAASERPGALGINYTVGPSFIAGGSGATNVSSVEPGVGTALQVRVTRNADFLFAYDYIDADIRAQAITFGGAYRFAPVRRPYVPFVGAGIGFGKPVSGEDWSHFSLKLTGGLEKMVATDIGLAAVFTYQYISGPDRFGNVHVIWPGIRLTYYFANLRKR